MKKRILSILLMCCMVLTLLPTTAFALTSINVSTEEELLTALADKTIDRIGVTSDITVSRTLEIDRSVEIVVASALQLDQAQSGSDRLFHITQNGNLAVWPIYTATRDITDAVLNEGELWGNLHGEVVNDGKIIGGYFHAKVINNGEIAGGEFYGEVVNSGEIKSGTFNGAVTNQTDGLISEGKFYGDVENNGNITGGVFYGTVTGGTISDSLYKNVTFDSGDDNAVDPQRVLQGQPAQRPADPIKDGYTFIGWYDKDDLPYNNMPEWNFRYSVTKDMNLVAQWMASMPISTEPITYLDKDGKQQTCTKYTVLESVTINDFFNSDDKWYDLPAGWYVVKGDVTFTPRLDTHGAVNLILTNGSHLTAEWGINVKEGDTFTVYAQSTDEDTMGRLTACLSEGPLGVEYYVWPSSGLSGIGSSSRYRKANSGIYESEGTIIINGGYILARGNDGASAIGGCGGDNVTWSYESDIRQCGSITINGGIVRTEALTRKETLGSVGIGSCQSGYGGSVTINGGTVMANASHDAICTGRGGSITINGGDITARGGLAGLGSGNGIGPS